MKIKAETAKELLNVFNSVNPRVMEVAITNKGNALILSSWYGGWDVQTRNLYGGHVYCVDFLKKFGSLKTLKTFRLAEQATDFFDECAKKKGWTVAKNNHQLQAFMKKVTLVA